MDPRERERAGTESERRQQLAESRVAILGCGGLGSNVAMMLLRAGVDQLTLVDFDRVEESNLNRQLYFHDQLGVPKVQALAATLRRIAPDARLRLLDTTMTEDNLAGIVEGAHVIVEAVDRAETKAMIVTVCLRDLPGVPVVSGSGLAGFGPANEIVTERFGEDLYVAGDLESDVRQGQGLYASRVMVAAAHQAHAVIRLLLGYAEG